MYDIEDNELVTVPLNEATGYVIKVTVSKREGEAFLNNPLVSELAIKACYEGERKLQLKSV